MAKRTDRPPEGMNLDVEAIIEVLETAPVTRAILFGSRARSDAHGASDIDLAVELSQTLSSSHRTRVRLDLISQLSRALGTDAVDVVPLTEAPENLLRDITADGIVLYGDTPAWLEEKDERHRSHEETMDRLNDIVESLGTVV